MVIAETNHDDEALRYIVEVNEYDDNGEQVRQLSRTPFEFPADTQVDSAYQEMKAALSSYFTPPPAPAPAPTAPSEEVGTVLMEETVETPAP